MDGCTYFSESHHRRKKKKGQSGRGFSEHRLVFIGGILQLPVTAADLGDCVWSGAAVSQSSGSLPETLNQSHKRYLQFVTPIK